MERQLNFQSGIVAEGLQLRYDFTSRKNAQQVLTPYLSAGLEYMVFHAKGDLKDIDERTDVFCLGIVFWELLTGKRLFDDGNQVTTIDAVRSRKIEPPSALRPEVPPSVDAIVMRALDRDRRSRFVSSHQMVGELRALSREVPMPPSKEIGSWVQQLFGDERVALKRAIAQGRDVEGALARLAGLGETPARTESHSSNPRAPSLVEPRTLWSTNMPSRPTSEAKRAIPRTPAPASLPPEAEAPSQRRRLAVLGGIGVALVGTIAFFALRGAPSPRPALFRW